MEAVLRACKLRGLAFQSHGPARLWQRHFRKNSLSSWPTIIAAIVSLSGCGGGGGSTGVTSVPAPPAPGPAPTLVFTSDVLQLAPGQNANLTWNSSATACTASGGWSGSKSGNGTQTVGPINVTTTFNLSCSNANSPATADSVTVTVPVISPPPPPPTANRVTSDLAHTILDYQRVAIGIRDIVWDPQHSLFYAVTRPDSTTAPNSLVSIDPATLAMQVRQLGSEAWCIAVSHNGTYLYVGYRNGGTVQRYLADGLVADVSISVGNSNSSVGQIVPSPVAVQTIAVAVSNLGPIFDEPMGVVIADDSVIRPDTFHGNYSFSPTVNLTNIDVTDVNWTPDGNLIYGVLRSSGVVELAVSTQGVNMVGYRAWPLSGEKVTLRGDELIGASGRVFDLSGPIDQLGQYADTGNSSGDHVFSEVRGKVFASSYHVSGSAIDGMTINSFDPDLYTFIDSVTFNGAAYVDFATVLLWGSDGIALRSQNELVIAHGTFAAAGGVPTPPPDLLTVTSNATYGGGSGALSVKILGIGALDAATNPCGELYVSTASWAAVRPNSVLQLDPSNAAILRAGSSAGDAAVLATSDDCSMLYAGKAYSNSIARIRLSDLVTTDEIPTGSAPIGLMRARAISVAPGQAQTVAVARGEMRLCGGSSTNMQVFDGVVARPVSFGDESPPGFRSPGIVSLAWGRSPDVLYAEDWTNLYALNVDASGPNSPQALMPYRVGTVIYDLGRDLHFDGVRNRIFNSFGNFYDFDVGAEVGPLPLTDRTSIWDSCGGTPGQAMTTDPDTGKIFWIIMTQSNQYSVSTYSPDSLANIVGVRFSPPGDTGLPMRVVRPSSNTLAIVTTGRYLILLQGSMLDP